MLPAPEAPEPARPVPVGRDAALPATVRSPAGFTADVSPAAAEAVDASGAAYAYVGASTKMPMAESKRARMREQEDYNRRAAQRSSSRRPVKWCRTTSVHRGGRGFRLSGRSCAGRGDRAGRLLRRPIDRVRAWVLASAIAGISGATLLSVVTTGFGVATTFALPSCNLKEATEGGPGSCPSVASNTGNGATTCGDSVCAAGNYCVTEAGPGCSTGCMATTQCPYGNYCDLTSPTQDIVGNLVGTCQQPSAQQLNAACPEDAGKSSSTDGGRD